MSLSNKIKELCKQNKISVRKLEIDLGFGNNYIARLTDTMPADRAVKVAEYFGLPADYFFPGTKKEDSEPQNPLIVKIMNAAATLPKDKQEEVLHYVEFLSRKG